MFTNYGPYDLHPVELIKQDKQRELKTIFGPATFEGVTVTVTVNEAHRIGTLLAVVRNALAGLKHNASPTAQPIGHQPSRV